MFSEYSWRKSLQLLSLLTSSSLILALFFFRPASTYHPQRRVILHLKEQQRQKFKQRLTNRKVNKNTYKLSNHFRQQSLEIGTKFDPNTNNKTSDCNRNGSVSSAISGSNTSGLVSGLNSSGLNNSAANSGCTQNSNPNNNETNSSTKSNTNPTNSTNSDGQFKQLNFKSKQSEDQTTFSSSFSSFFFQRQSTRQQISFRTSFFRSFNKRCLNSLSKLTQSNNLIEYLDLLKSRDFKFIIMSSFLCCFVRIYFSIVSLFFL